MGIPATENIGEGMAKNTTQGTKHLGCLKFLQWKSNPSVTILDEMRPLQDT